MNYNNLNGKSDEYQQVNYFGDNYQFGIVSQTIGGTTSEGGAPSDAGVLMFPVSNGQPPANITFPTESVKEVQICRSGEEGLVGRLLTV